MSGGGGVTYEVSLEGLHGHAGSVDQVASGLDQAAGAAETTLGTEAFGVLCQFLPPFISTSQTQALEAIQALADQTRTTADKLRKMSANYGTTEGRSQQSYTKSTTALPRSVQ
jgi:hypothetical protein